MERPVYKIRGHHFLVLPDFLYSDERCKKLDAYFTSLSYGEDFVELETKIWTDFVEGRCGIKLIDKYDTLCLDTGCYKNVDSDETLWMLCARNNGKEDREIIRAAGLELGKEYLFDEIVVHKPEWYYIQRSLMYNRLGKKERHELQERKSELEREEKQS